MTTTHSRMQPLHGSYLSASFERARVYDVMRMGVFTCQPETSLREVARIMATHHVHAVAVTGLAGGGRGWGIVSDRDVVRAAALDDLDHTAGEVAGTEVVTIEAEETLARAAQLMAEHEISHLLVVQRGMDTPRGVVSTLDVAGSLAWGEA